MNGTRELHNAEIVVRDQNKFLTGLDGPFPIPAGACVIDTSRSATAMTPYTCFSEQAPSITDVKVVVSDSTQHLPETREMIVGSYYDGNTKTRISYYWHPDQPGNLVVHVNMDSNLIVPVTDPRNWQRKHYGTVLDAHIFRLLYLHLKPHLRPSQARLVAENVNNQNTSLTEDGISFWQSYNLPFA